MASQKLIELEREINKGNDYITLLENDLERNIKEAWQNHLDLCELMRTKTSVFIRDMEETTRTHVKKMKDLIQNQKQLLKTLDPSKQTQMNNYDTVFEQVKQVIDGISGNFEILDVHYKDWYIQFHQNMKSEFSPGEFKREKANRNFPRETLSLSTSLSREIKKDFSCQFPPPNPKLSDARCQIKNRRNNNTITGIFVNKINQVVVCDYDANELHFYKNNDYWFTDERDGMQKPIDICPISSDEFCLIDAGCNLVHHKLGDDGLEVLKQTKTSSKYDSLCWSQSGYFLACNEKFDIHRLDIDGKLIETVFKLPNDEANDTWGGFHKIRNAPFRDSFLVLNRSNKNFFIVNMNGNVLFTTRHPEKDHLTINDFCTDRYGNIYLFTRRKIYLLIFTDGISSWKLESVHDFGSCEVFEGYTETFIKDDSLYISTAWDENEIRIFSLDF